MIAAGLAAALVAGTGSALATADSPVQLARPGLAQLEGASGVVTGIATLDAVPSAAIVGRGPRCRTGPTSSSATDPRSWRATPWFRGRRRATAPPSIGRREATPRF